MPSNGSAYASITKDQKIESDIFLRQSPAHSDHQLVRYPTFFLPPQLPLTITGYRHVHVCYLHLSFIERKWNALHSSLSIGITHTDLPQVIYFCLISSEAELHH